MPDPSGSTPIFGFPFPEETDIPDVATAIQLLATAVENTVVNAMVPIGGSIGWEIATLPALGVWLFEHGQTVTVAAFPDLAAARPSWVSGSNIILPDSRDRMTIGAGGAHAGGTTGGSATVSLTTGHIPRFNAVAVAISDPGHFHAAQPGFDVVVQTTSSMNLEVAGSGTQVSSNVGNPNTDTKATGISATVTFGNTTPTPVNILNPFYAEHKIVRAA